MTCAAYAPPAAADHPIPWRGHTYPCRTVMQHHSPSAAPLLILSGGLQTRHSWGRLERHLAPLHPLLIPDLPPARSPGTLPGTQSLSWDDLTDAALHAADHLGIKHFAVLGVSSGFPIAYRLAQQHPDRISDLMLFGAAPRPGPRLTALIHEGLRRETDSEPPDRDRGRATGAVPGAGSAPDPRSHREVAERLVSVLTNPQAGRHCLMIRAAARVMLTQLTASPRIPLSATSPTAGTSSSPLRCRPAASGPSAHSSASENTTPSHPSRTTVPSPPPSTTPRSSS